MANNLSPIHFVRKPFSFEEFLHQYTGESSKSDISYITGTTESYGVYHYARPTIINDLTLSEEEIYKAFSATTRNEINQIDKNALCTHDIIRIPTESDITSFRKSFDIFASVFQIKSLNIAYMSALQNSGRLCISYVSDRHGDILVGHAYRLSNKRPELYYSFRKVCDMNHKDMFTLISKSNRYSHYRDMKYFKSEGYECYDFGGYYDGHEDIRQININKFKLSFGGQIVILHNSILYNSLLAKAYIKIKGNQFAF